MKKAGIYCILLLFLIQSTGSLWIISAFYINRDYIAQELCVNRFDKIPVCYGKCYLDKKLSDNEKKEQKAPGSKEKETQPLFMAEATSQSTGAFVIPTTKMATIGYCEHFTSNGLQALFRPPKTA